MKHFTYSMIAFSLALLPAAGMAQNPIIQAIYTPDPAPCVHGDTLYLFVDHDEDSAADFFKMKDWLLFSTTDMVNWTYRGKPMSTATFAWARQGDNAWAAQAVEREGKWYWYVAAEDATTHLHGIGVAVADRPEGPYRDALGKPLLPGSWGFIDPSVFIDDDGQAYLFWGNNGLWYAPLNEDMISLKEPFKEINTYDVNAFGPHRVKFDWSKRQDRWMMNFEEAPWVYKRNGLYYMEYAAGGVPEHWAYSTAPTIHGPWTYRGRILDEAENSFTIHGGSIGFRGRNFMFYHNGILPGGDGYHRSAAVEEFAFNADGSIPFIPFTKEGIVRPVCHLNPYQRVEAETMAWGEGIRLDSVTGVTDRHYVTSIHEGDYERIRCVDFGKRGAHRFKAHAKVHAPATVEVRLDYKEGRLMGMLALTATKGEWKTFETRLPSVTGVHDLYLIFRGGEEDLLDFDWWQMK